VDSLRDRIPAPPRVPRPPGFGAPLRERRAGPFRILLYPPEHPTADIEIAAALVGAVTAAALLLLPLGKLSRLVPECRFHEWTGWPCATCGISRGLIALGEGAGREALRSNPLLVAGLLASLAYALVAATLWAFRLPRPRIGLASRGARLVAMIAILAAILVNWAFLIADGR
jgi:hypothetical protein